MLPRVKKLIEFSQLCEDGFIIPALQIRKTSKRIHSGRKRGWDGLEPRLSDFSACALSSRIHSAAKS